MMRLLRRSLLGVLLLSITVALLIASAIEVSTSFKARAEKESVKPQRRERVFSAHVIMVEPKRVIPTLTVHGTIAARKTLDLRSLVTGTIVEISDHFETGARIQKGDVLLKIDPTDFERSLQLSETDLNQARNELSDAKSAEILAGDDLKNAKSQAALRKAALARQRDLVKRGVGTEAALENALLSESSAQQIVLGKRQSLLNSEARVAAAEIAVERAIIRREDARQRLEQTSITAELSGVLEDATASRGGVVLSNEKLGRIIDLTQLEVSFRLSATQYSRIFAQSDEQKTDLGSLPILVQFQSSGVSFSSLGQITRENASVDSGQTGRQLYAIIDKPEGFRSGDFVSVEVSEPPIEKALIIPATALSNRNTVMMVNADNRLEEQKVDFLRRQGKQVIVKAPALAGREIVEVLSPILGRGIQIKPLRKDANGNIIRDAMTVKLSPAEIQSFIALIDARQNMPDQRREALLEKIKSGELPNDTYRRLKAQTEK